MPRRTIEMPKHVVAELSFQQKEAIIEYEEEWRSLANEIQTKPIDKDKVSNIVKKLYSSLNLPKPTIVFFSNPYKAIDYFIDDEQFKNILGKQIDSKIRRQIYEHNNILINRQITDSLHTKLINQILFYNYPQVEQEKLERYFSWDYAMIIREQLVFDFQKLDKLKSRCSDIAYFTNSIIRPLNTIADACILDFCISKLNLQHDKQKWKLLQDIILHCSLSFTFQNYCLLCERPKNIILELGMDSKKAVIEYADNYDIFVNYDI